MDWESGMKELERRRQVGVSMGGPERIERHHKKG